MMMVGAKVMARTTARVQTRIQVMARVTARVNFRVWVMVWVMARAIDIPKRKYGIIVASFLYKPVEDQMQEDMHIISISTNKNTSFLYWPKKQRLATYCNRGS